MESWEAKVLLPKTVVIFLMLVLEKGALDNVGTAALAAPTYVGHLPLNIFLRACLPCLVGFVQGLFNPGLFPPGGP